jgi:hypothetical protein
MVHTPLAENQILTISHDRFGIKPSEAQHGFDIGH